VLWDLAVHDLSIMDFVLRQQPVAVSATGLAPRAGRPENIAYMTMFFDGSLIAHVNVNWLSPVKVRRTLLSGSRRMVVFDDLEASEKIKVYDRGISLNPSPENVYQMLIGYRAGDMWAPQLARQRGAERRGGALRGLRPRRRPAGDRRRSGPARGAPARSRPPSRWPIRGGWCRSGARCTHDSVRGFAGAVPRPEAGDRRRGVKVLDQAAFILGPAVAAFEKDFAAFCGTREAVGVNSGTSALHLALLAAGVGPG
jgi:hypothetical protein